MDLLTTKYIIMPATYLKDTYLAQDALQEIYIQVMKKLPDLKEPELFISWLNTIAFHVCYDIAIRKSKVEFSSSELFELLNFADSQNTPEEFCTKNAVRSLLKQAIDSLSLMEQQIIVLRYFNDLTMEEISKACSVSLSSIKRHHHTALKQMKKYLEERE
ncbi:sigma-70 family RNA polymerase sigma factor [Suilimivivens sp.]|uniref:RNA polymerase sigma factor n=1 Tax=Suilimivivens sp. TaxID=2981669 RepID=UPI00307C5E21